MIVHEAATTFVALYHALIGWLIFLGVFAAIVGCTAVACIAPGVRLWRGRRKQPAAKTPKRRVPSWAHTEPYEYEEAA